MQRRDFIAGLGVAVAVPLVAGAQQPVQKNYQHAGETLRASA
jgi:hypothetical protein